MANLRTNNLSGEGGKNAISGSVFFDGDSSYLALASGVVPSFGTGDFTIEFWINQGVNSGNYTGLITLTSSTAAKRFETAIHSSTIQVYTDTGAWRDTGYAPVSGQWEHIAFQRDYSGNTLKMYANGEEKWSVSNTRDYDEAWTTSIGLHGEAYNRLQGYISNLRICKGHRVYSSNYFTPPTSELEVHYISENDKTTLLCCQDSDDAAQEATGKTIIAYGYFGGDKGTGNLITNALDWDGATDTESSTMPTNWTAGSGATAEYDTGGTSGGGANRMLRLYNDGSNSFINQEIPTVIGQRYFYYVWYRAKNSSLGVRIAAGTSSGDGTNLSDQYNVGSANTEDTRTGFFTATATTTHFSLRVVSGTNGASVYWDDVIVRAFNPKAPKVIPPYGVDAGNTFGGAISMNSSEWMYFPTGRAEERGRGRGIIHGGYNGPSSFGYNAALSAVEIASDGVTSKFGDLFQTRYTVATAGSSTRSVFIGGGAPVSPSPFYSVNTIDFVTIATKGNAQNFGDTDEPGYFKTGVSSSTRGVFTQGRIYNPSGGTGSVDMEYITIATKGDGIQFGDLVGGGRVTLCNAAMSPTRGILAGGVASPVGDPATFVNTIEYVTMATLGNSVNFGDLKKSGGGGRSNGNCSSNTRGVFSVGTQSPADGNVLNFITIATTGDALDFGDLSGGMQMRGACSNQTRGLFAGGFVAPGSANYVNTCEKITIATTGSASDWGDTFEGEDGRGYNSGISDSHGGLS